MLNNIKSYGVAAVVALSFVSCSVLSPKSSQIVDVVEGEPIYETIVDTMEYHDEVPASEHMVDSLMRDTLFVEPIPIPVDQEEEPERDMNIPHFEGDQTTSVVIPEYRGVVIEDMVINLSEENSFYPADGHVTSKYGWRKGRMHAGIDLKALKGDNLYAAFDGVVRLSKYYSSFGYCVIIRHYNGLETLYAHATKLLVEVNDEVKAGDVIALAGSTGRSTGSHLHFEVRVSGNYIDPALILDTENRKIKDANLYVTMRNGRLFASNNDSEEEREAYILQQISIKYYTVRSGDVLSRIAANNGTTVATLCRLNGISSKSVLRIGQRLIVRDGIKVPAKSTTTSSATTPSTTSTQNATKSSTKSASTATQGGVMEYRVKKGDTLSAIAAKHGTTVTAICNCSGITSRTTLQIGQRLSIPTSGRGAASSASSASPEYYKIKSGDTLSAIAKRHGTTVSKLCSLNGISSTSTLSINQRLRIR
ncbi:MAG: LysM peptidoglycan-binding domain-containing protein [Rikenellaceae bacterium]